ncbi:MAG: alpha/beta hydrolase [Flavobacteriaceae bacterium]|nr:alpha/beta hydrolase [Flavobacteriaceae bacterium]
MNSKNWKSKGNFISINNHNIFVIDEGNSNNVLVILHGYPTSTFDYYKVLPQLTKKYRVILHDHLGFGFSDKPKNYSYSLIDQAEIALQLWSQLGLKKVTLLAHDYGTSVATEIITRHNDNKIKLAIEYLILCNGSMHVELAQMRTIQKLLKGRFGKYVAMFTNFPIFSKNMQNVYYDKDKVSKNELQQMWIQLMHNNGRRVIHLISRYNNERYTYWNRWIGALKATQISTKIIWATEDPVAIKEMAELLSTEIPNNCVYWVENCGHFPMLECPNEWTTLVLQ